MLTHQLLREEGILILNPEVPLDATDFQELSKEIDPYIEANGRLQGLMIDAAKFPGWHDFAALVAHIKFVKDHHQLIERVAVVSDSGILSMAPKLASHFLRADIKHFARMEREDSLRWLRREQLKQA